MNELIEKVLKLKLPGIQIVIDNQKGVLYHIRDHNKLRFRCPICDMDRNVDVDCEQSYAAFIEIGLYPIVKLICEDCHDDIWTMEWILEHPEATPTLRVNRRLKRAMKKLGWID